MQRPFAALKAGLAYLKRNPGDLLVAVRHAAGLRVVIPLDAVRWLVAQAVIGKIARFVKDVDVTARRPALGLGLTAEFMGNQLRAEASIFVEELRLGPDELRITLRVGDLTATPLGDPGSPVAALIKSGALDLSKPANLLNFLPNKSPALVEAKDDRFVLDLMQIPKIARNPVVKRVLGVLTPVLVIRDLHTEGDHLVFSWRLRREGLTAAIAALRAIPLPRSK